MATSIPSDRRPSQTIEDSLKAHWGLFLAQGVIMIFLGVMAMIWPHISTIAAETYVGWAFLLSGIVGLATLFWTPNAPAFFWSLLTAALAAILGVLLLWHPVEGVISLTLALTALFIVEGVFQVSVAIRYRDLFPQTWGWMAMSGIADFLLAGLIVSGWPGTATWTLGLLVGVNLATSGFAIVMAAIAGRRLVNSLSLAMR